MSDLSLASRESVTGSTISVPLAFRLRMAAIRFDLLCHFGLRYDWFDPDHSRSAGTIQHVSKWSALDSEAAACSRRGTRMLIKSARRMRFRSFARTEAGATVPTWSMDLMPLRACIRARWRQQINTRPRLPIRITFIPESTTVAAADAASITEAAADAAISVPYAIHHCEKVCCNLALMCSHACISIPACDGDIRSDYTARVRMHCYESVISPI